MPDNRFRGPEEPMGPAAAMVTRSVNYEFNGDANYHAQDPWIWHVGMDLARRYLLCTVHLSTVQGSCRVTRQHCV
jgi:hypothetical protein